MERIGGFDYKFSKDIMTDCRVCSALGFEVSATRITSTLDWDFFYCSNCKNWFQVSQKDHSEAFLIQDKKQVEALEYCEKNLGLEANKEQVDLIRKIPRRLSSLFYRMISPYLDEGN